MAFPGKDNPLRGPWRHIGQIQKKTHANAWNYPVLFITTSQLTLLLKDYTTYYSMTVLSSKLMEEKKRTFSKHTAWGKKLINMLTFQPEQDRANKSLKRNQLVFCTWSLPLGSWVLFHLTRSLSSLTRKYKKPQTAQKFLYLCKEGEPLCGRGPQTLLLSVLQ